MNKCLVCFEPLEGSEVDYHRRCSERLFGTAVAPTLGYSLDQIQELASKVISERLAIPGVQPKLSLTFDDISEKSRLTIIGIWNGLYVLKPPQKRYAQLPENEALIMTLAELCEIDVARHGLIRFKSGEFAYIAKRFDRIVNGKQFIRLAQEDMCQLTGQLTENKYFSSMEKVAKAILAFSTNKGFEISVFLDVAIFSFLVGNSDMHLKNFSLLTAEDGGVRLTPAYDLVSSMLYDLDDEQSALSMNGKKNKISLSDFQALADYGKLPTRALTNSLERFSKALPTMKTKVKKSFLNNELGKRLIEIIEARAKILGIG